MLWSSNQNPFMQLFSRALLLLAFSFLSLQPILMENAATQSAANFQDDLQDLSVGDSPPSLLFPSFKSWDGPRCAVQFSKHTQASSNDFNGRGVWPCILYHCFLTKRTTLLFLYSHLSGCFAFLPFKKYLLCCIFITTFNLRVNITFACLVLGGLGILSLLSLPSVWHSLCLIF